MNKPHPHAALMAEYAQDATETETPWERWDYTYSGDCFWKPCDGTPFWAPNLRYRRKPSPTGLVTEAKDNQRFWFVDFADLEDPVRNIKFTENADEPLIELGLLFHDKDSAERRAQYLLNFMRSSVSCP
jgi:hypothetical protein